jgi:hypothetical protein
MSDQAYERIPGAGLSLKRLGSNDAGGSPRVGRAFSGSFSRGHLVPIHIDTDRSYDSNVIDINGKWCAREHVIHGTSSTHLYLMSAVPTGIEGVQLHLLPLNGKIFGLASSTLNESSSKTQDAHDTRSIMGWPPSLA